jgi:hypothetical protein
MGLKLPEDKLKIRRELPKPKGPLTLDPVCLSCSGGIKGDLIKQFKIACLAYAPGRLVYRNIDFSRDQLRVFRKFLLGQSSKIV